MLILKLALRTLLRRKARMALIGVLVLFGTFLVIFGGTFSQSAAKASKDSIIHNFTGDFIVYSERSKDLPSPFAFNTPLPILKNPEKLGAALKAIPEVEAFALYAQNYGIVQVDREGKKIELPFIFYAVQPDPYRSVFSNIKVKEGSYFGLDNGQGPNQGILISTYQNEQYQKNYGVTLRPGESVTLLGITEGGVNTVRSTMLGIFEPLHYKSVFDYINFMDSATYSNLYNYTGIQGLPSSFNTALTAASGDEGSIFQLANDSAVGNIDLSTLKTQALSGFTMVAVKLKDHSRLEAVMKELGNMKDLEIKVARWDVASGFYAQISKALQLFIFIATALIFLVVILIFMNTLIINVVERTSEIGTMRAIGAEKSFIRRMFLLETLILNLSAALVAMVLTGILFITQGQRGIPLPETVSQFLIGGGPLPLSLSAGPFVLALVIVFVVSVLATVYPVRVATAITPLKAMSDR